MPQPFSAQPFTDALLAEVQGIDCGSDVHGQIASAWISGGHDAEESAVKDLGLISSSGKPTRVWLYKNELGQVVGYGSLGGSNWRINNVRQDILIIPHLGLCAAFHGQSPPGGAQKYSVLLMADLYARALEMRTHEQILGLYVYEDNLTARALYNKVGFTEIEKKGDKIKMALLLEAQPNLLASLLV